MASLKDEKPDKELIIRGVHCPYALLEVKKALKTMDDGKVLKVISDERHPVLKSIPNFCRLKKLEYEIVDVEIELWHVFIRKT
ncbi:MAG: sulfurtransferase TusA family protein [Candidatus Wukongarchaeota archaeon]|jgi:TusA-related sulfurtransferase|nr:sulfurtransferase TusA family protein [Candidatus Wukongarchaeota archaeon]MDO8128204.1 sulfurtransferase TusA family protein [Candidatus Wukongarchaeota archaeon]